MAADPASSLPRCGGSPSLPAMTVRARRSGFLAPLLAFLAILVTGGLSGWHGAAFHDDEPVFAMSFEHVHGDGTQRDSDSAIHLAAHAVVQGMAIPAAAVPPHFPAIVAMAWPIGDGLMRPGSRPASLLRPPRG